MKNYLERAKKFSIKAYKEFIEANRNEDDIRQSAEKGWLAIVEATNYLLQKKGIKIPHGTRKREELLSDLEEKDKKIKELRLEERYSHFLHNLHCDCFYDGTAGLKIVRRDLNKINEYIGDIEKI